MSVNSEPEESATLSEDQKSIIRASFKGGSAPNLTDLTRLVFGNPTLDARNKEGRAVKKFISEFQIGNLSGFKNEEAGKQIFLSKDQEEFILDSLDKGISSTLSIAQVLFQNPSITPLHKEHKAVHEFVKLVQKKEEDLNITSYSPTQSKKISVDPYKAPVSTAHAIARINKYLNYGWREDLLKKSQLKQVESLMNYLKVFRFQYQINSYSRNEDRELFEDAFIRYTHDKDDLTQEELDQFITLSNEVVIAADIQRRIEYLRMSLDEMASDSEGKKISMGLNEAINNAQTEYNQCISRQDKLYKSLTVNRSKRIEEKINENASILNLVYAWKQEENRARMIQLAERQREALKDEVERLSSIDEFRAIVRGLDPKEVLNT